METTVVNMKQEPYDVYIGRGSAFGNPFPVKIWGRDRCIELYKAYLWWFAFNYPEFRQKILELRGKRLGCYCKPQPCHGDVIVEYLETNR